GDTGLLAADLLLEAGDLGRRVEDVDRGDRALHLALRLGGLLAGDELVAPALELLELAPHLGEAGLELVDHLVLGGDHRLGVLRLLLGGDLLGDGDRKSTRLNSSHVKISYAVFWLQK